MISGEQLDVAEQPHARGQRSRPKTEVVQDRPSRGDQRPAFVEASRLRDQTPDERAQVRTPHAVAAISVQVTTDPSEGLLDRRGAPVERGSDLPETRRGRPAG